jgi:hypothetical protein
MGFGPGIFISISDSASHPAVCSASAKHESTSGLEGLSRQQRSSCFRSHGEQRSRNQDRVAREPRRSVYKILNRLASTRSLTIPTSHPQLLSYEFDYTFGRKTGQRGLAEKKRTAKTALWVFELAGNLVPTRTVQNMVPSSPREPR